MCRRSLGEKLIILPTARGRSSRDPGMYYDIDESRGSFQVTCNAGAQASTSKEFDTGSADPQNLGGGARNQVSFQDIFTAHSISATNAFRNFWKTETTLKLYNLSNSRNRVRMYVLVARQEEEDNGPLNSALAMWDEYNNEYDVGTTRPITVLDNTPYEAPGFGRVWYIARDFQFEMIAGGHRDFKFVSNINKDISLSTLGQGVEGSGPHGILRARTWALLITVQGFPAADETTPTNINTSQACVTGVWVRKCWSAISEHTDITTSTQTVSAGYGPLAGNGDKIVIPQTGEIATWAFA